MTFQFFEWQILGYNEACRSSSRFPFHQNWKPGADFLLKHLGETNAKCKPEDEFVSLLKFRKSSRLGLAGKFLPKQMTTCCNLNFVSNIYYSSEFYSISYCFIVVQSLSHIQLFVTCSSPRLTGPSLSSRVCTNWNPSSQWCHSTISFSVTLFLPSIFPSIKVQLLFIYGQITRKSCSEGEGDSTQL